MEIGEVTTVVTYTITYTIHYSYPSCFDDGGIGHDLTYHDSKAKLRVETDGEARLQWLAPEFHEKEHGRYSFPTKLEKTVVETTADGWRRETVEVLDPPRSRQCPCGKGYWPIKGETACHELMAI